MSQQLHNELKKEFQLERLILFSDAVFAIAITFLVIEIPVAYFINVFFAVYIPMLVPLVMRIAVNRINRKHTIHLS